MLELDFVALGSQRGEVQLAAGTCQLFHCSFIYEYRRNRIKLMALMT